VETTNVKARLTALLALALATPSRSARGARAGRCPLTPEVNVMLRTTALFVSLALASPALAAPAGGTGDVLAFPAVERTLPNGLRVIVVPTGFPDLVSIQIPIQTGSRNEVEPGKSGFAHFFEHMMFRGTKAYPPDAYQAIVTRIGARQNAYTSDDVTNYHLTFAKDDLEKVLEIEADRFMNLDYSVAAFKTESRAILGEYDKNASNPMRKLDEVQRDSGFRAHPYKHTTMGFLADIEDMPNQYEYSKTFYARWYRPEHAAIVVAGDVDPRKVLPLVERYFGKWKRGAHRIEIPCEPATQGRCTRTSHGRRRPCRGSRSRSMGRRSRTCRRTGRRWTSSSTSTSARRASSRAARRRGSRRSTRCSRTPAGTWTRGS
jgi:zinc protease